MSGKYDPSFLFAWSFLLRSGQQGLASEQAEAIFLTFRIFEKAGQKSHVRSLDDLFPIAVHIWRKSFSNW